ncbi:MAG: aminopeptidase [Candidatus Thermoplasmatota archaeon]
MDERIKEHAEILVEWSTEVEEGDNVVISAGEEAKELVVALQEEIAKKGANPITLYSSSEASRAYLKNFDGEFETPEHVLALMEESDVIIGISSDPNLRAMNDVPGDLLAEYSRARQPIKEEQMSKRWCGTQHPTNAQAQMAEMSLEEYKDFVYDAILRDWQEVHDMQEQLKDKLDEGSEVYIEGAETELTMSIDGMIGINSDGDHNMPSGEVFTAPVVDSVDGEILFDKPLIHQGKEIDGVKLKFEDGEVVEYSAEQNEEALKETLGTDEGAKRLGELGIGTNRGIDVFTKNMLFDEKMGDTIHLALGRAYDRCVGEDREQNESAIHVDMIKDMSEGILKVDEEVIMKDGKFIWEM